MRTVDIPADALNPGDVIETTGQSFGLIVMHGWDMEGSFGYFVRVGINRDYSWAYHHQGRDVWKKRD